MKKHFSQTVSRRHEQTSSAQKKEKKTGNTQQEELKTHKLVNTVTFKEVKVSEGSQVCSLLLLHVIICDIT